MSVELVFEEPSTWLLYGLSSIFGNKMIDSDAEIIVPGNIFGCMTWIVCHRLENGETVLGIIFNQEDAHTRLAWWGPKVDVPGGAFPCIRTMTESRSGINELALSLNGSCKSLRRGHFFDERPHLMNLVTQSTEIICGSRLSFDLDQLLLEHGVDQGLIPDTLFVCTSTGCFENRVVEHDSDSSLALVRGDSAALAGAKIVTVFHASPFCVFIDFMPLCFSYGNQTHEIWVSVCIDNDQDTSRSIISDRDPALLVIISIFDGQGSAVVQYRLSLRQANAMLTQISSGLLGIKLDLEFIHYAYLVCMCGKLGRNASEKDRAV